MPDVIDRPALERPTAERPSIEGAQFLPLALCEPSPFNPRKRFNQARLEDLANSIEKVGVLQPALMRPKPGAKELLADQADPGKKAKPAGKKPAAKKAKAAPVATPIDALADADAQARKKVSDDELDELEAKGWPFPGTAP